VQLADATALGRLSPRPAQLAVFQWQFSIKICAGDDIRSKFRERQVRRTPSHLDWLFSGFATYQSLLNLHRSNEK